MIRIRFLWPLPSLHCLKAITRHEYPSEPVSHERNTISSNAACTNTFTQSQSSRYAEVERLLVHYQLLMSVPDHTLIPVLLGTYFRINVVFPVPLSRIIPKTNQTLGIQTTVLRAQNRVYQTSIWTQANTAHMTSGVFAPPMRRL